MQSVLKYLLDTNVILGLLKATPEVLVMLDRIAVLEQECDFSAVTRMELLGYPGITAVEDALIREKLARLCYVAISSAVEDRAIELRRSRRVKLPDALIAATAACHGLQLLALDVGLESVMHSMT